MELREYQQDALNHLWAWLSANPFKNPVVVAPTGSGKSILIAKFIEEAIKHRDSKGDPVRVIVLAHVKELLEQEADKLSKNGIDYGIYSAGLNSRETDKQVIIAGIQSVYKRADELGKFHVAIVDEAHRIPAVDDGQYRQFLDGLHKINDKAVIIGFTATPYRTGSGCIYGPDKIFDDVCYDIDIQELIHNQFLSPLVMKGWSGDDKTDFSSLHTRCGEFVESEVSSIMTEEELMDSYCRDILDRTKDRHSVLIFTINIDHANKVKDILNSITSDSVEIITGDSSPAERAEAIQGFKDGSIKYLINVNVLTTGFDAPNCDCVALLRPTYSAGLYVQMIGRGLRLAPNKTDCLILDYGKNVERHGPIDAVYVECGVEWRDKQRSERHKQRAVKKCPACQAFIGRRINECPFCGFQYPPMRLDGQAGDGRLFSDGTERTEYTVLRTTYIPWDSKKHPGTQLLRVQYECDNDGGIHPLFSDWLSPEAYGWQRKQFVDWWMARAPKGEEPPLTAGGAATKARYLEFKQADRIAVTFKEGEKYPSKIQVLNLRDQNENDKRPLCGDCVHWHNGWCVFKSKQGIKATQLSCGDYTDEIDDDDIPF